MTCSLKTGREKESEIIYIPSVSYIRALMDIFLYAEKAS